MCFSDRKEGEKGVRSGSCTLLTLKLCVFVCVCVSVIVVSLHSSHCGLHARLEMWNNKAELKLPTHTLKHTQLSGAANSIKVLSAVLVSSR